MRQGEVGHVVQTGIMGSIYIYFFIPIMSGHLVVV